jgi:hypothetical protein
MKDICHVHRRRRLLALYAIDVDYVGGRALETKKIDLVARTSLNIQTPAIIFYHASL